VDGAAGRDGRRGDPWTGPGFDCGVVGVEGIGEEGLKGDGGGRGMDLRRVAVIDGGIAAL